MRGGDTEYEILSGGIVIWCPREVRRRETHMGGIREGCPPRRGLVCVLRDSLFFTGCSWLEGRSKLAGNSEELRVQRKNAPATGAYIGTRITTMEWAQL